MGLSLIIVMKPCIFQKGRRHTNGYYEEHRTGIQIRYDKYSSDVMVAHLQVLLNYTNRFYSRQFLTRKHVNSGILLKLDEVLSKYLNSAIPIKGFTNS